MRPYGYALAAVILLDVLSCAPAAWGATPTCSAAPGATPLQVDQRTATRLLMSETRPTYPPLARINYIHGDVSLLLTVGCTGRVQSVHVVRGHPFLAAPALQAIRKWIYRPFVTHAGPSEFQTVVNVNFALLSRNLKQLPPNPDKFLARRVRPPELPPGAKNSRSQDAVHMRVLVNAIGRAIDFSLLSGNPADFNSAKSMVSGWEFKPAKWGTLSVPWYMEVSVPPKSNPAPAAAIAVAR
ncbi:MAG: energy transducer TonB [Acidobacteriota bacterium]|nr:energy transducer TonB [Acidobacteriota bacterium]